MKRDVLWIVAGQLLVGCDEVEDLFEGDTASGALLAPTADCPLEHPADAEQAQARLLGLAACLGHAPERTDIACREKTYWYGWDQIAFPADGGWIVGEDYISCGVRLRDREGRAHEGLMGFALESHKIPANDVQGPLDGLPEMDGCALPQRLPGAQAPEVAAAYVDRMACLGYPAEHTAAWCWGPPTQMQDDGAGPYVLCRVEVPAEGVGFQGQVLVGEVPR